MINDGLNDINGKKTELKPLIDYDFFKPKEKAEKTIDSFAHINLDMNGWSTTKYKLSDSLWGNGVNIYPFLASILVILFK